MHPLSTTLLAVLLLLSACAGHPRHGSIPTPALLERTVTVNNQTHKFAIWVPASYNPRTPCPCVLFLHGSGECGSDGLKQTTVGLLPAAKADPSQWPCIIVMPQKPTPDAEWEDFDSMVIACLDAAEHELNIDKARTSLTGLSQGGHGTWTIAANHPDLFSRLAPICGYVHTRHPTSGTSGDTRGGTGVPPVTEDPLHTLAKALSDKPIWAFHGEKDDIVPPSESREMIEALKEAHTTPEPRFTLYPQANHNAWDNAYRKENLGEWLTK